MARPVGINIVEHMPIEELNKAGKEYEKNLCSSARLKRMHDRIAFVRMRYRGYSVEEASSAVGFTFMTGYNIQKLWNEGGLAALEPNFNGGRPSKLTDEEKKEIDDALLTNPMCAKYVRLHIKETYGIDYSMKQVHMILKNMKMHHAKRVSEGPPLSR